MEKNPAYNKKYNLRLPQALYDKIEELSHTYDRSSNEQIVHMLRTWQEPAVFEDRLAKLEAAVIKEPQDNKNLSDQELTQTAVGL